MRTDILEQRMLEDTLETFQTDDYPSVTPAQGVMLIDGWLQALENDLNVEAMQTALNTLREQLNSPAPDRNEVKNSLIQLADQIQDSVRGLSPEHQLTDSLQRMGVILRDFSNSF